MIVAMKTDCDVAENQRNVVIPYSTTYENPLGE